jgi:hypothetical protein
VRQLASKQTTANNHHMGSKAGFFRHVSEGQRGFLNKKNEDRVFAALCQ